MKACLINTVFALALALILAACIDSATRVINPKVASFASPSAVIHQSPYILLGYDQYGFYILSNKTTGLVFTNYAPKPYVLKNRTINGAPPAIIMQQDAQIWECTNSEMSWHICPTNSIQYVIGSKRTAFLLVVYYHKDWPIALYKITWSS